MMMGDTFTLGGDPAAIRGSAGFWSTFSNAAGSASTDIKGMDSSEFIGDEGDTYRGKVNDDLSPHLDTTSQAWGIVSTALSHYSTKLEWCQQELAKLKTQYVNQQQVVSNAQSAVSSAKSADSAEHNRVTAAKDKLKPGETLPASTYVSATGGAQSSLTEAQSGLDNIVSAANKIRSEHKDAVDTCCREIDRAKDMRFEKPPGFWDRLKNSVVDWVKDHADILTKISGVLKIISAIAGVLSFIPILAPIMGPIALVTGGAALLIDVGLKLATGKGSWLSIGIDALTMVLPGAGKLLGKGLKTAVGAERVAGATSRVKSAVSGSKAVTALCNSPALTKFTSGVSRANAAFERAALKVPGVRAANVRAGRIPANSSPRFTDIDSAMGHARPRLQHEADQAWASATAKSDPAYFKNPNAHGPQTRWDEFVGRKGRDPDANVQGTWAHTDVERALNRHGGDILPPDSGYRIRTEVSYGPHGEVPRSTSGSKRPDIVVEQRNATNGWDPAAAVDLKTGKAGITDDWRTAVSRRAGIDPSRIEELRPGAGPVIPAGPGVATSSTSGRTALWATPVLPMPSLFMNGS